MAEEVSISILLPLIVGFIIGIIEVYFIYGDESMAGGRSMLGDMWHGLIFSILGVLVASNVPYVIAQGWIPGFIQGIPGFVDENGNSLIISIFITIFMFFKIVAARAIKGTMTVQGFKEKAWHKLLVAAAIGFAPYYIFYFAEPLSGLQALVPWIPF